MNLLIVYAIVGGMFAYLALLSWASSERRLGLDCVVPTISVWVAWPLFLAEWVVRIRRRVNEEKIP